MKKKLYKAEQQAKNSLNNFLLELMEISIQEKRFKVFFNLSKTSKNNQSMKLNQKESKVEEDLYFNFNQAYC